MPTMNVNLTPEMAEFVSQELASGDYVSASELVRDALRTLRREREFQARRDALFENELTIGLDQARRGEFSDRTVDQITAVVLHGKSG